MSYGTDIGTTAWEKKHKVKLLSLEPYKHLFPPATGVVEPHGATSIDKTVTTLAEVVRENAWQVEKFVAQELADLPFYDACKKLWWFVRFHIEWVKDKENFEQISDPAHLIATGKGDCDCMTCFVDCCLHALKVNKLINRTAGYDPIARNLQHIYTVVPTGGGKEIIIDACWPKFNAEKQFVIKKDYIMELQVLHGIGEIEEKLIGVDAQDLFGYEIELGELGKLLKKKQQSGGGGAPAKKGLFKKSPEKKAAAKQKRKAIGKKVLKVVNKVNKINPATVLLRAGILASMKLNVMKVAEKIKWGYATPEYAQSKGMDMTKYEKIKGVLAKTQQIFYASGGNPENLKKAILTGHGNKNHEVSGMGGYAPGMSLSDLLGDIYTDEFVTGMEGFAGFDGLGNAQGLGVVTTTAVAAASTAMGSLAALLKSIGNLFPNKNKKDEAEDASAETEPGSEPSNEGQATPEAQSSENSETAQEEPTDNLPATTNEETEVTPSEETEPSEDPEQVEGLGGMVSNAISGISGFYEKNKSWIRPVGVVVGVGVVALIINHYATKDNAEAKAQPVKKPDFVLSGTGKHKFKNKNKHHKSNHKGKKTAQSVIALM